MSVTHRAPRRVALATLALSVLLVLGAASPTAAASPAAAGTAPAVPKAVAGARILVTYRDALAFGRGGATSAARQTDVVPALLTKVFTPRPGREQRAMRDLAGQAGVVSIESDVAVATTATPNDPLWAGRQSWAHDTLGLRKVWNTTRGSAETVIAILDSGVETSHPEFAGRLVGGWDFVEGDATPNDPRGHGTMSAGAAAARGNNGSGVAGACWSCRIMPVRVLNSRGSGYASWVVQAIIWATDHGADVISMSFGGFARTTSMANAIAYARSRGVVVIASAGNDGNTRPFYPASHPGVIGVVATDPNDRPYSWSNRGSQFELAAPGCLWSTKTGRSYGNFCGTSASAPLVAGLAGLLRSARPDLKGYFIERALLSTARRASFVSHGIPNGPAALAVTLATPRGAAAPPPAAGGALTVAPTTALILRAGPSTGHRALATLAAGTTLRVTGSFVADGAARTWVPVRTGDGRTGFVAAWLVSARGSAAPTANVILRAGPSTGARALTTVRAGSRVTVVGSTADGAERAWLEVRTGGGATGYMAAWLMRP